MVQWSENGHAVREDFGMARRRWVERDHPRHPAGDKGGQFRDRVGSGGWAAKIASMVGTRRSRGGRSPFDPMAGVTQAEEGDASWLGGNPDLPPWQGGAQDDDDVYRRDWGVEVRKAILQAGHDPDEIEQRSGGDLEEGYPDYQADPKAYANFVIAEMYSDDADGDLRRELAAEANAEFGGETELERGFAEAGDLTMDQIRAPLRAELLRRVVAASGPGRLTNQEVARALSTRHDPEWVRELLPTGGWSGEGPFTIIHGNGRKRKAKRFHTMQDLNTYLESVDRADLGEILQFGNS